MEAQPRPLVDMAVLYGCRKLMAAVWSVVQTIAMRPWAACSSRTCKTFGAHHEMKVGGCYTHCFMPCPVLWRLCCAQVFYFSDMKEGYKTNSRLMGLRGKRVRSVTHTCTHAHAHPAVPGRGLLCHLQTPKLTSWQHHSVCPVATDTQAKQDMTYLGGCAMHS